MFEWFLLTLHTILVEILRHLIGTDRATTMSPKTIMWNAHLHPLNANTPPIELRRWARNARKHLGTSWLATSGSASVAIVTNHGRTSAS